MRKFFDKYLILLLLFCLVGLLIFLGHTSNIIIDVGREVYYPQQIIAGKVLYKDLFNIYGPLAYQINALLYKFFGIKLSILYFSGAICSVLSVIGIYSLAKRFLSKFLSFSIAFLVLVTGVYTTSIFSFHFPYSWAVLYGSVSFIYSLYFLLKYEDLKNARYLIISAFLAGMCFTFKYDFLLYSLFVLYFVIKNRDIKAFLSFICVPLISYGTLFFQGLNFSEVLNTLKIYKIMASSVTLKYFYQNSGVYFHPKSLPTDFILFLKFVIPSLAVMFGVSLYNKNKFLSVILTGFLALFFFKFDFGYYIFGFLPVLLLVLTCLMFKNSDNNTKILTVSALLVSIKVFWVLLLQSYGNYYFAVLLIACLAVWLGKIQDSEAKNIPFSLKNVFNLKEFFLSEKKSKEIVMGIILLIISAKFMINGFDMYKNSQEKLSSENGTIYTSIDNAKASNELIEFLKSKKDRAVIFPEGLMINFLSKTESDDYYNSLLPLYDETFESSKMINHFENVKPKYIILNNLDMKDYYFRFICTDYAGELCGYINKNYNLVRIFGNDFKYLIFERNQ